MNALLAQRHRPSLGLSGALGGAVRQLLRCGVLQHSAVGYLWRAVTPPVPARDEGVMLDLLTKFDLLLPGPEPGTSFVPLLLPPCCAAAPRARLDEMIWTTLRWSALVERADFKSAINL